MGGIDVGVAILLLIAFIAGVMGGIVIAASVASRREDRLGSLTGAAPDRTCGGARLLIGAGVRGGPSPYTSPRSYGDDRADSSGQKPPL